MAIDDFTYTGGLLRLEIEGGLASIGSQVRLKNDDRVYVVRSIAQVKTTYDNAPIITTLTGQSFRGKQMRIA